MEVVKATNSEDIDRLKPIAWQWKDECNSEGFGIEIVPETYFADLATLISRDDADLFLLTNDKDEVVGYMGIECFNSPLGSQKMANEHYWFVAKEGRGRGSLLLIKQAREWAKEKGCTHLIFNASNLASDLHDKVCGFYEHIGMKKFETSFIQEIL